MMELNATVVPHLFTVDALNLEGRQKAGGAEEDREGEGAAEGRLRCECLDKARRRVETNSLWVRVGSVCAAN